MAQGNEEGSIEQGGCELVDAQMPCPSDSAKSCLSSGAKLLVERVSGSDAAGEAGKPNV